MLKFWGILLSLTQFCLTPFALGADNVRPFYGGNKFNTLINNIDLRLNEAGEVTNLNFLNDYKQTPSPTGTLVQNKDQHYTLRTTVTNKKLTQVIEISREFSQGFELNSSGQVTSSASCVSSSTNASQLAMSCVAISPSTCAQFGEVFGWKKQSPSQNAHFAQNSQGVADQLTNCISLVDSFKQAVQKNPQLLQILNNEQSSNETQKLTSSLISMNSMHSSANRTLMHQLVFDPNHLENNTKALAGLQHFFSLCAKVGTYSNYKKGFARDPGDFSPRMPTSPKLKGTPNSPIAM